MRLNVAGDVLITADSVISAAGRGAPRNQGAGPGGVFNGTGGGGGHRGMGGDSLFGASGGASYGWAAQPILPGSGGGVDPYQLGESSSGGGVIRLIAGGELRADGNVNADGQFGWADDSGGGAGGSIWLTSPHLPGTGSINAIGSRNLGATRSATERTAPSPPSFNSKTSRNNSSACARRTEQGPMVGRGTPCAPSSG